MRSKQLGHGAGLLFLHRLEFLEEVDHRRRVIPGFVEILQAQQIGFALEIPGVLEEGQRHCQTGRLARRVAAPSAHEDERYRGQVRDLAPGCLTCPVAGGDVCEFVRENAGDLRLVVGLEQEAGMDEDETARQREGVDLRIINDLDRNRHGNIGIAHQVLSDPVDIFRDHRVVDDLRLTFNLARQLTAQGDFILEGVEVQPSADITVADLFRVFSCVPSQCLRGHRHSRGEGQCTNHRTCHSDTFPYKQGLIRGSEAPKPGSQVCRVCDRPASHEFDLTATWPLP